MAAPPATVEGFRRVIRWAQGARRANRHHAFSVIPHGGKEPVGLVQLWRIEADFSVAECGFGLTPETWGTGIFDDVADVLLAFAFDIVGVHRLEARAAVPNARGIAALRKLGMQQEGHLRRCFRVNGQYMDHYLLALLAEDWRRAAFAAA